jgi:hypothetical protein
MHAACICAAIILLYIVTRYVRGACLRADENNSGSVFVFNLCIAYTGAFQAP